MRRRSTSSSHGFTLIEMMVVLSIIAVIAALAIPSLRGATHKKDLLRAQLEMNEVVRGWISTVGQGRPFFPTGSIVNIPENFPVEMTAAELEVILEQPVPEEDPWGNLYQYRTDAQGRCLAVVSANRDGSFNDEIESGVKVYDDDWITDLVLTDPWWLSIIIIGPRPPRTDLETPVLR